MNRKKRTRWSQEEEALLSLFIGDGVTLSYLHRLLPNRSPDAIRRVVADPPFNYGTRTNKGITRVHKEIKRRRRKKKITTAEEAEAIRSSSIPKLESPVKRSDAILADPTDAVNDLGKKISDLLLIKDQHDLLHIINSLVLHLMEVKHAS